ncbi:MAG TPA: aminoglycoside adenylyltransferase domain-containing protein [Ktedonobacterales bacterium]|nr:aminoglycoside adenylyltransferase domain-containing protein [Ktedonobacterales bacterium]
MHPPHDITDLLDALLPRLRLALGDNLVGVYLRGSLAMGDFDADTSDLDFAVVTARRVSAPEFAALSTLHTHLATLDNRYATRLEAPYLDLATLRRFQPGERHPTIYCDEPLVWSEHFSNWVLERWVLREHGVTLLGPDLKTLIDPIAPAALQVAARARLRDWARWADQPDDAAWCLPRAHNAYVVQTMCRALCTLASGELPSKPRAVAWAVATLPEPWRATVARARAWHNDQTPDPAIVPEVGRFVRWAAAQDAAD